MADCYTGYHGNHNMGVEEVDLRSGNSWQMELQRPQSGFLSKLEGKRDKRTSLLP